MPALMLVILHRIRFTNNIIAFILIWLTISAIPYIVSSSEMVCELSLQNIIIYNLKILGVLFAFLLGYTNSLKYNDLCKVLFTIFLLNFILMSTQFFLLKPMILTGRVSEAKWTDVVNPIVFWKRQVVGICGNSNAVGSFILVTLVFLLDWLKQKKKLFWVTIVISIIAIGLYAKSRNSILVGLLFIGYYLFFIKKKLNPVLKYSLFGLIFLFVVFFSASSEITDSIFRFTSFENRMNSYSVRLIVDKEAFDIWWNHVFWFGGGFGSESFLMGKYHATRFYSEMLYTKYLLEMGIIGTSVSAFFLYVLYKNKLKEPSQKRLFKNLLFVIVFVSFFETVFYTQQLFYFLLFIFAWISNHAFNEHSKNLAKNER